MTALYLTQAGWSFDLDSISAFGTMSDQSTENATGQLTWVVREGENNVVKLHGSAGLQAVAAGSAVLQGIWRKKSSFIRVSVSMRPCQLDDATGRLTHLMAGKSTVSARSVRRLETGVFSLGLLVSVLGTSGTWIITVLLQMCCLFMLSLSTQVGSSFDLRTIPSAAVISDDYGSSREETTGLLVWDVHERAGRGGKGDVVELNDDEEDLLSAVSEGSAVVEGSWGGKRNNLNVTAYLHQP